MMSAANASRKDDEDELQQKNRELLFARECLSRFTYAISHELNSPVNTFNGLLEILKEEHQDQLDPAGLKLLDMIILAARRTQDTVTGILEFSQSASPLDDISDVDSRVLLDEILQELQELIETRHAQITIGAMPTLRSSANGLRLVLRQLIINGLKFTDGDNQPALLIETQTRSQGCEFVVSDKGLGIDPAEHENIFGLFKRLHARSDFEGAGLGLPIALQVVQQLEGSIWVTQDAQGGSAFHVFLPNHQPK